MSPAHQLTPRPPELGFPESDWQRTPMSFRDEFLSLLKQADASKPAPNGFRRREVRAAQAQHRAP